MYRFTLLLIPLLFFMTSCTVDWNDEKDTKISELEKQVTELKNTGKNKEGSTSLEIQDKCAKKAKEFFDEKYSDVKDANYENHYSEVLNKCFVKIGYLNIESDTKLIWTNDTVYDVYEGKIYADYAWRTEKNKKYWEVKPMICQIGEEFCNTTQEFDSGIKKYMEN